MSEAKILESQPTNSPAPILRDECYRPNENASLTKNGETITTSAHTETKPSDPSAAHTSSESPPPPAPVAMAESDSEKKEKVKPTHYKVVCISLYTQDIASLEEKVAELKRRGHTKANKSQLIRQALRMLDIDALPPPQQ